VVTDHQIRDAVKNGTSTWKDLVKATRVSSQCGICARNAKGIFRQAKLNRDQERRCDRMVACEEETATGCGANQDAPAARTNEQDAALCACAQPTSKTADPA
jgi:bacterioferritin-associated ferredoxin